MHARRLGADHQCLGDLAVRPAGGEVAEDLPLPRGQGRPPAPPVPAATRCGGRRSIRVRRARGLDLREQRSGPEPTGVVGRLPQALGRCPEVPFGDLRLGQPPARVAQQVGPLRAGQRGDRCAATAAPLSLRCAGTARRRTAPAPAAAASRAGRSARRRARRGRRRPRPSRPSRRRRAPPTRSGDGRRRRRPGRGTRARPAVPTARAAGRSRCRRAQPPRPAPHPGRPATAGPRPAPRSAAPRAPPGAGGRRRGRRPAGPTRRAATTGRARITSA